jgi:hypothetical protein
MIYRFYQDLANAHIAELEHEAQGAHLARRRAVHVQSKFASLTGLAPRLVTRLRRLPGSHRPRPRASAHLVLMPPKSEIDLVADQSVLAREVLGGESHIAGVSHLRAPRHDSTLRFEDGHLPNIAETLIEEEHRAVQSEHRHGYQVL